MFTMEAQFPQLSVCVRLGQHPLSTSGCQLSGLTWDARQVLILAGARLTPKQSTCPGAQMIDLSGIFQIQFQPTVISPVRKPFLESGQKTWRQTICENTGTGTRFSHKSSASWRHHRSPSPGPTYGLRHPRTSPSGHGLLCVDSGGPVWRCGVETPGRLQASSVV